MTIGKAGILVVEGLVEVVDIELEEDMDQYKVCSN